VENVVPPLPADAAAALGAFLAHRGRTLIIAVYLVVWISNVAGAAGVYYASRRYGRRFFATPAGRRLLSPDALRVMEREYLRFGLAGIFLTRLFPGVRAVVAPFTGLIGLSPLRAIVPMALASGLWFGAITYIGATVGAEWERIQRIITDVNRGLAIVGVAVALAAGAWYLLRRRRRRPAPTGLWRALRRALQPKAEAPGGPARASGASPMGDAALLLLQLAYADDALTAEERAEILADLRERWGLRHVAPPRDAARETTQGHIVRYRERLVDRVAHDERLALVERLWHVALVHGRDTAARARLVEMAGRLLGLSPAEVNAARREERHQAERERGDDEAAK
jgi:LPXTG-motif cell wall-anchored protein